MYTKDPYIKDLFTLFLIFAVVLVLTLRFAEVRVYSTMGLDIAPITFDFKILPDRTYDFCVLDRRFSIRQFLKIGDFYADRRRVDIKFAGMNIIIPNMVRVYDPANLSYLRIYLDKKYPRMYN
ncbi:hypothetical protein [Thermosediminibacter oceani]|uniref:Uncharacterized protein n=1 Tax=Thermosediminibacter oceani (strain ATCC BAA-1034 / DSM 16646 / JW/IW-1228P) TaxID=555079 RepID=D9S2N7_THEOJ|nr:hypothetical protein [Thermosediminibacter oceani]ADL07664.1 hypothetical protein Toce_0902 [Thermosediminibacter oceani DSM 16646]